MKKLLLGNCAIDLALAHISYPLPENTHCWEKYHCTSGLKFYKFGFSCFTTYKKQYILFLGQVQSCKTGDKLCSDPSPNGECYLPLLKTLFGGNGGNLGLGLKFISENLTNQKTLSKKFNKKISLRE